MKSTHRTLAGQCQPRDRGLIFKMPDQKLIHTCTGSNLTPSLRTYTSQDSSRPLSVPADNIRRMMQAMNKIQFPFEILQRSERRTKFECSATPLCPPLRRMNPVPEEKKRKSPWISIRRQR
jgi:hypothetical protein